MSPSRPQPASETAGEPGAERFWNQFSQTGKSQEGERGAGSGSDPDRNASPTDDTAGSGQGECLEWCPICRSAELVRHALTPELREQAEALQAEAVKVFQGLLAAYAERAPAASGRSGSTADDSHSRAAAQDEPEVTDIPLD